MFYFTVIFLYYVNIFVPSQYFSVKSIFLYQVKKFAQSTKIVQSKKNCTKSNFCTKSNICTKSFFVHILAPWLWANRLSTLAFLEIIVVAGGLSKSLFYNWNVQFNFKNTKKLTMAEDIFLHLVFDDKKCTLIHNSSLFILSLYNELFL